MKIAVISDIHGNNMAFEIALADIKKHGVDQIVCLGDAIQGGPQPTEVAKRLQGLQCPVVMGNADAWLLSGMETGDEGIPAERLVRMEEIRQWSLSQLSGEDRKFILSFQPTVTISLEGELDLLCFHGSPTSFDDIILPDAPKDVFEKYLGAYSDHLSTGGHTHPQQVRRNGDLFFFNPGSVGFAFAQYQSDGQFHADPWVEYATLKIDSGQTSLEFRRIPFDVNELIGIYRNSGRPFADEAIAQYQI